MQGKSLGEILIGIIVISFVIFLFISLLPVLFYLGIGILVLYVGFYIFRRIKSKISDKIDDEKYDESGRRIVKISVLDMEDAGGDKKKPEKEKAAK